MVYSGKRSLPDSFEHSLWTYHANRALLDLFIVVEHLGAELRRKLKAQGFSNARAPASVSSLLPRGCESFRACLSLPLLTRSLTPRAPLSDLCG